MKKNSKPYFYIAIILLISSIILPKNLVAQANYKKGYFVKNSGDTLKGEIDYRNWYSSFKEFTFKTQNKITLYKIAEVQTIYIQEVNEYYQRYAGQIDNSRKPSYDDLIQANTLQGFMTSKQRFITDSLFLRVLVKTKDFSLLSYLNPSGIEHFFLEYKDNIQELLYQSFILNLKEGSYKKDYELYKTQLTTIWSNCPSINSEIAKMNYNREDMEKLFRSYAYCTQSLLLIHGSNLSVINTTDEQFKSKQPRAKMNLGIVAGVSLNSLSSSDLNNTYIYPLSVSPALGMSVTIPLARDLGKWNFHSDFVFSSFSTNPKTTLRPERSGTYLKANAQIRRKFFPLSPINPYLSGGLSISNVWDTSKSTSSPIKFGYLFSAGINVYSIGFEARYETQNGANITYFENFSNILFLLSYKIK